MWSRFWGARRECLRRVRQDQRILVIDKVSESQGLQATEEEIDSRVEEIADKSGKSPAKVYANLQKSERLEALEREITERKVFEFLKEQSEIVEN